MSASSDYRSRTMSGTRNGMAMETDWFGGGYPPGYHAQQVFAATAVAERPVEISATSAFTITTADVLDVLGPDADDVLATANLDVDALISMINDGSYLAILQKYKDDAGAVTADVASQLNKLK